LRLKKWKVHIKFYSSSEWKEILWILNINRAVNVWRKYTFLSFRTWHSVRFKYVQSRYDTSRKRNQNRSKYKLNFILLFHIHHLKARSKNWISRFIICFKYTILLDDINELEVIQSLAINWMIHNMCYLCKNLILELEYYIKVHYHLLISDSWKENIWLFIFH
jgi:hypothetical protein